MPTIVSIRTAHAVVNVNTERKLPATVITIGERGTSKEIGEIARSGLEAAGFNWPRTRINVHIEPYVKRAAGRWDDRPLPHATLALAVAIGVLVLQDELSVEAVKDVVFHADMSLDGRLRPVREVFAAFDAVQTGAPHGAVALARSEVTDTALQYVPNTRKVFLAWDLAPLVDLLKERVPNATGKREGELAWPERLSEDAHPVYLPLGSSVCLVSDTLGLIDPQPKLHRILRGLTAYSSDGVDPTSPLELIRALDWHGLPLPEPKQVSRPLRAPHHTVSLRGFEGEVELAVGGVLYLEHVELLMAPVLRELRKPRERCVLVTQVDNWTQAAAVRRHLPPNTIFLESL